MTVFKNQLHRYQYWQGQMLRSADFQAQTADTAQHRWWHNRALHNAYGVYQGLTASPVVSAGGEFTRISIAAGVGYDCFGRELIVDSPQTIALPVNVPTAEGTMVLLIRYETGADCPSQVIDEICWTTAGSQTSGTVSFVWLPLARVHLRAGVPLAQIDYDGKGGRKLSPKFVAPGARPIARPAIASGATVPAATAWEAWNIEVLKQIPGAVGSVLQPQVVGVQVEIDTSAAGFTRTPCYFAWLAGPLFNASSGQLLPDMFSSLTDESPTGFTFRMWFPPPPIVLEIEEAPNPAAAAAFAGFQIIRNADDFYPFARRQKLYVQWLACQMPVTVPYVPLRLRILNESLVPLVLRKTLVQEVTVSNITK